MVLYVTTYLHLIFVCFATGKRVFPLYIKHGVSLQNAYSSIVIQKDALVLCGLLCKSDNLCQGSSFSRSTYICSLYDISSTMEISDGDKVLIYQNSVQEITTDRTTEMETTEITTEMETTETTSEIETTTVTTTQATTTTTGPSLSALSWENMENSYSLMKPNVGCPEAANLWVEGSQYHDTEDDERYNGYIMTTNMAASQDQYSNIEVTFCSRNTAAPFPVSWPSGNYCIVKHYNCPSGFVDGFVYFDDENNFNANRQSGTLPAAGIFALDTTVYYCCRSDGSDSTPVNLPVGSPFYLLKYTGNCQSVASMTFVAETIEWYCQTGGTKNLGTVHPYEDGSGANVRLHFCYYS